MIGQLVNWDYLWGQIVARAWANHDFKQRLLTDPLGVLDEYDVAVPAGFRLEVIEDSQPVPENTGPVHYLVLPARPSDEDLSEDELCSVGGAQAAERCGCEWCQRCERCHRCERCEWCRCHHPPRPEEK
jgi:hypothetical protein